MLIWWYRLFQIRFENGLGPSVWRNIIIYPKAKCATKDPFVPLNYRVISLLSCVSKTNFNMLNNRIVKYCNLMGIFQKNKISSGKIGLVKVIYIPSQLLSETVTENKGTLLINAISWIELNGSLRSGWFENICGVRQGDCLSPTLFNLYIIWLCIWLCT